MEIKQLRKKSGLSQSEFAKKYNLSVRTLQQWEQGISKPLSSLVTLIQKDIEQNSNLRYQYNHNNENKWRICIDEPFLNCDKVYPLQQNKVKKLIIDLSANKQVLKIIVFGSSVTNRCHIGSDVDIYVESEKQDINTKDVYDFEYDLWTNYSADKRLISEIEKKGVVVYARN